MVVSGSCRSDKLLDRSPFWQAFSDHAGARRDMAHSGDAETTVGDSGDAVVPLAFVPYVRPQVWGGRELGVRLGKSLPGEGGYGEAWDVSGHRDHVTVLAAGAEAGRPLDRVWAERAAAWTGGRATGAEPFPLLLKWLDCRELLSVQVHPNDALAMELRGERFGKTEAWVVLDAAPTGRIYAGLREGVTPADLAARLEAGTVDQCLHQFRPHRGDCLFLRAGTVHAVGGGVLMAEVQQSSDATFRLFDWNRLGTDGKPRALHREESLRAIDWSAGPVEPVVPRVVREEKSGALREKLVDCAEFTLERWTLGQEPQPHPRPDELSLVMVLEGTGAWGLADGGAKDGGREDGMLTTGESRLVPAGATRLEWRGAGMTLLLAVPKFV
jgi:mannose-6-phosphate isomerase